MGHHHSHSHTSSSSSSAWSSKSSTPHVIVGGGNGKILFLDAMTGEIDHKLTIGGKYTTIHRLCQVSDDLFCGTMGGVSHTIPVLSYSSGTVAANLEGHQNLTHGMCYSDAHSTDELLLTGGKDIKAWNMETATCQATFAGHRYTVAGITTIPGMTGGNFFFSGSSDYTVKKWDFERSEVVSSVKIWRKYGGALVRDVCSVDGNDKMLVVASSKGITLWDAHNMTRIWPETVEVNATPNHPMSLCYHPRYKALICGCEYGYIQILDIRDLSRTLRFVKNAGMGRKVYGQREIHSVIHLDRAPFNMPTRIVSTSGDSSARCWDITAQPAGTEKVWSTPWSRNSVELSLRTAMAMVQGGSGTEVEGVGIMGDEMWKFVVEKEVVGEICFRKCVVIEGNATVLKAFGWLAVTVGIQC